jgi:hypothetical protein
MRNGYKILSEKYSSVQENDKEDILAGLSTIGSEYANINKPATRLITFTSGDVDIDDKYKIPAEALPVGQEYYTTKAYAPTIFYEIWEGHFVWYFTEKNHRKLVTGYYNGTLNDRQNNEYEALFEKLIQFPPYVEWEELNFAGHGDPGGHVPPPIIGEDDKEDILSGLEDIERDNALRQQKVAEWNKTVDEAWRALSRLESLTEDPVLKAYYDEISEKYIRDDQDLTDEEDEFYTSAVGASENFADMSRSITFDY